MQATLNINPIYENVIFNDQNRYLVLKGSGGSGKSRAIAQKLIIRMLGEQGHRFLVTRKVKDTLKNSVFEELKTVIQDLGVGHLFTCITSPLEIRCRNKNKIIFIGADDPEKMKSLSGITGIWIEEATDFEPNDFDQLDLRLRGTTNHYQQICLSFNPISEQHWLKARFFDVEQPNCTVLSTTFKHNRFLTPEHGDRMEQLKLTNPAYYRIYALGEWGLIKTGTEFWYNFSRNNVEPTRYNPELPLWLSFDFNVNPYLTCIVAQVHNGKVYILKEVLAKHPNNDTASLCAMVLRDYGQHPTQVFITGDPAGKHQDTRGQANDYTIIQKAFGRLNVRMQVPTSAPSVHRSGTFANGLLATGNIIIGENCVKLINDLEVVKQGADGGMIKEKVKDKVSKLTIEPHGHLSDALRYLIITIFAKEFNASFATQGGKVYS
jgi:hypothetical protein